ncbi:MAG: hypothetical protein WCW63_02830 [Acholeplasmataceae bacterium]
MPKEFVESEHPRDRNGEFTAKNGSREEKIQSLTEELNATYEKKVYVLKIKETKDKYFGAGPSGGFKNINTPIPMSKNQYKKAIRYLTERGLINKYETEEKQVKAKIVRGYFEEQAILEKIEALKKGYDTPQEYKEAIEKERHKWYLEDKTVAEMSIFTKKQTDKEKAYYDWESDNKIEFNYNSFAQTITNEAKKQGATVIHTSAKKGSIYGSSIYLKKGDVEIRLSNHELPQIMDRTLDNYETRWDREEVLDQISMKNWSKLKTEDELRNKVKKLFMIEEDE